MKTIIGFCDFTDAFARLGRESQFSYEAKQALFEYLEELEESTGEEIELDVISICCEYTEYESLKDFQNDHSIVENDYNNLDKIREETEVIELPGGGFIVRDF